jgi:DNA processing protein
VVEASHTSGARMQARLALEHGRPVFFPKSMLEHRWAQTYESHGSVYVVEDGAEIVDHLERLYSTQLELVR